MVGIRYRGARAVAKVTAVEPSPRKEPARGTSSLRPSDKATSQQERDKRKAVSLVAGFSKQCGQPISTSDCRMQLSSLSSLMPIGLAWLKRACVLASPTVSPQR
jgi:hypothetical protein